MSDSEAALPQALPVAAFSSEFDPSRPPSSGEEFLRFVRSVMCDPPQSTHICIVRPHTFTLMFLGHRYEAQRCPDVVVAQHIDPRQYDRLQTIYAQDLDQVVTSHLPAIFSVLSRAFFFTAGGSSGDCGATEAPVPTVEKSDTFIIL